MATTILRPNADTATQDGNIPTTPAGQTYWSMLDDVVTQPTAPSTVSDYILTGTASGFIEVGFEDWNSALGSITEARLWVYEASTAGSGQTSFQLRTGATVRATKAQAVPGAAQWRSIVWTASISDSDADDFRLRWSVVNFFTNVAIYAAYIEVTYTPADSTPPTPNIISGPDKTRISSITGQDEVTFTFEPDEACQAWKVKSVPNSGSAHTAGTQIESGGALTSGQDVTVTITDDEMTAAGLGSGDHIIKVFVQDSVGNWST